MKKYAVVCYAVHDKDIASCDWFDDYESAQKFLEEDANNTYEEEVESCGDDDVDIWVTGNFASLSSCDGDYEWTWHIVSQ